MRVLPVGVTVSVHRSSNEAQAQERASWLADLAVAIDEAQRLAWRLGVAEGGSPVAKELYGRLETLRAEVASLRRAGWATHREEIEPPWMNLIPWATSPGNRAP